jgi:uncharacterized protein YjcR
MDKAELRKRVFSVFSDYLKCLTIPEISEKYGISSVTVFRDIQRAREATRQEFYVDIDQLLAERIAERRRLIRKAETILQELEQLDTAPEKARAQKEILSFISSQDEVIETLLGFSRQKFPNRMFANEAMARTQLASKVKVIVEALGEGTQILLPEPESEEAESSRNDDEDLDDEEAE